MTFTTDAWGAIRQVRESIGALPFLLGLEQGSLPRETFDRYLEQDVVYLRTYAKVLALTAAHADVADDVAFWSQAASNAVAVETMLHVSHGVDADRVVASSTCTAYTSYLLALTATASYPVMVAGVLPYFWIYDDVGRRLKDRVGNLATHPYGDWIETYGDPAFEAATGRARCIADRTAENAGAGELQQMHAAFMTASRYEWMFWDAGWRGETWPI